MEPAAQNSIADYCFSLIKNLNQDNKLDLISKLSQSLKSGEEENQNSLKFFFGAYKTDETAEEIIAGLRASRNFSHQIELL